MVNNEQNSQDETFQDPVSKEVLYKNSNIILVDKIIGPDLEEPGKDVFKDNNIELSMGKTVSKNKTSKPLPQNTKNMRKLETPG